MAIRLYMDHHVPRAITLGLRLRGVDVLTAYEDGAHEVPDDLLLTRATALGRTLFTQDDDLLAEAAARQESGQIFGGVIFAPQSAASIGRYVHDLALISTVGTEEDVYNQVIYLPL